MKKVLLSLSLLAATVIANAQITQFVLWNASPVGSEPKTEVTGTPFPFKGSGLTVDTSATAPYNISVTGTITSGYYVGGFGVGSYATTNVGAPWLKQLPGTKLGYTLYIQANIPTPGAAIQVILNSKDSITGHNTDGSPIYENQKYVLTTTTTGLQTLACPLSGFSNGIGQYGGPDNASFMTEAFADSIHQIQFSVNVGTPDGNGGGTSNFTLESMWISKTNSITSTTAQVAGNISSASLYPNPTSGQVNANLTLQNAANVSMIVTDMMGKQIATQNFGSTSSLSGAFVFNSSNLAKGMYTVTYVLDGTPAKTELVAVQ